MLVPFSNMINSLFKLVFLSEIIPTDRFDHKLPETYLFGVVTYISVAL